MSFGIRLRQLREMKGITQEELGKKLNLTKANISKYELGKLEPNFETLTFLADYFEVSTDYLLGKTDDIKTTNNDKSNESDIFDQLGEIIKRDAKPLTKKDKERLLKIIESAWPVDDDEQG